MTTTDCCTPIQSCHDAPAGTFDWGVATEEKLDTHFDPADAPDGRVMATAPCPWPRQPAAHSVGDVCNPAGPGVRASCAATADDTGRLSIAQLPMAEVGTQLENLIGASDVEVCSHSRHPLRMRAWHDIYWPACTFVALPVDYHCSDQR